MDACAFPYFMLLVMIQWVMKVPLNVGVQFNQSKKFYYLLLVCLQNRMMRVRLMWMQQKHGVKIKRVSIV
ncbi:unnamed protein product [Schistosoma curassoni]|uniref:Secreted protein n=1 Tax=Schistosoma curassoni TaxID=6186 RepID=A0A183KHV7_9TREM|nr:unnamed protein product [Schistosoma curassoni]